MYFDTSYIAKFYFNEPESARVRELVRTADTIHSSLWALAEFHAVLHRRLREGSASPGDARDLSSRFDAVHLATAQQIGESEVWTNDRHMLAAAPYFGLRGRSF